MAAFTAEHKPNMRLSCNSYPISNRKANMLKEECSMSLAGGRGLNKEMLLGWLMGECLPGSRAPGLSQISSPLLWLLQNQNVLENVDKNPKNC